MGIVWGFFDGGFVMGGCVKNADISGDVEVLRWFLSVRRNFGIIVWDSNQLFVVYYHTKAIYWIW